MDQSKSYKIRVPTPEISRQVQLDLFKLGCKWATIEATVQYTNCPYLYAQWGRLTHSSRNGDAYFMGFPATELSPDDIHTLAHPSLPKYTNCKLHIPRAELDDLVINALLKLGYVWAGPSEEGRNGRSYLYISGAGKLLRGEFATTFRGSSSKEIRISELIPIHAYPLDYCLCKVHVRTPETSKAVQEALSKIGCSWASGTAVTNLGYPYLYIDQFLRMGSGTSEDIFNASNYRELNVREILFLTSQIKQTISQNKDGKTTNTGKAVELCRTERTITGGERPSGESIRGRRREFTVTSGHLSYQSIHC